MPIQGWVPFYTFHLLDNINDAEYVALSVAQRNTLGLIISAGQIDYHIGTQTRDKIETMFPVGTITRDNLEALLAAGIPPI